MFVRFRYSICDFPCVSLHGICVFLVFSLCSLVFPCCFPCYFPGVSLLFSLCFHDLLFSLCFLFVFWAEAGKRLFEGPWGAPGPLGWPSWDLEGGGGSATPTLPSRRWRLWRHRQVTQKECQEDQGEMKDPGDLPQLFYGPLVLLAFLLALPWVPWNSFKLD